MKNENLKLAIQKNGRLTNNTIRFLFESGLEFNVDKLSSFLTCKNFPLDIILVRDDDTPYYVETGTVDLGIVGQNVIYESNRQTTNIVGLNFGFCSLSIAVPVRSNINIIEQLRNVKIATSYPNSTKKYFDKKNIPIEIIAVSGSVEIAPSLGIADAIVDLVSTGQTLATNNLRVIDNVFDSQAMLITGSKNNLSEEKQILMQKLIKRFKKVLSGISSLSIKKLII